MTAQADKIIDLAIDTLVYELYELYELYGLMEEEIKIVEGGE